MEGWSLDRLLYAGEDVESDVRADGRRIVVTSHRVLVLPGSESDAYHALDRPNVRGVSAGVDGGERWAALGTRVGVAAIALAALGFAVRSANIGSTSVPETSGAGAVGTFGIVGTARTLFDAASVLGVGLLAVGGLLAVLACACIAAAWVTSTDRLVLEIAGGEDVGVPMDGDVEATAGLVSDALGPPAEEGGDGDGEYAQPRS